MSDHTGEGAQSPAIGADAQAIVGAIAALAAEVAALKTEVAALKGIGAPKGSGAPGVARAAGAGRPLADKASVGVLPKPKPLEQVESDRVWDQVDGVLAAVFMAALDDDSEAGFEAFLSCMHSDRTDAPRSIPSLKEFTWKSLRKHLSSYLGESGDASGFAVARRIPEELEAADTRAKLFVAAPGRSPVPVSFRRDPERDDAWRVTDTSL